MHGTEQFYMASELVSKPLMGRLGCQLNNKNRNPLMNDIDAHRILRGMKSR